MWRVLLELVLLVGLTAGAVYGAYRLVEDIRRKLGGDPRKRPPRLDPVEKAQELKDRLEELLSDPGMKKEFMEEIVPLIERIPMLEERMRKLERRLETIDEEALRKTLGEYEEKLARTRDEGLRKTLARNVELARERLDYHARMKLLMEKTMAQIDAVLLGLEALQDKLIVLDSSEHENVAEPIENLREELDALEKEYREMRLIE